MITNATFYLYTVLFFFLDILLYSLLQKKMIYFLFCFYSFFIFQSSSFLKIVFLLFFLTLESFFDLYGYGVSLFYLLPVTFLVLLVRPLVHSYSMIPSIGAFLICFICHHSLVAFWSSLPGWTLRYYTFYELCANILLLFVCLKFFKGRRDNRF